MLLKYAYKRTLFITIKQSLLQRKKAHSFDDLVLIKFNLVPSFFIKKTKLVYSWNPPFIAEGGGLGFRNFCKKGDSDFSPQKRMGW